MNRRARLQMRLQGIVQGISIAALAYYLSGLTVYLAKGLKDAGWLPAGMTADMLAAGGAARHDFRFLGFHGARAAPQHEGARRGEGEGRLAPFLALRK
ncbi:MAG: DUF3422 family protein [Rhodomicrobium sp.]